MTLPRVEPMLATNVTPSAAAEWAVEPKLDGWRSMVYLDDGVTVRTRSGREITTSIPELAPLAEIGRRLILDGELVADAGRAADFYGVGPRLWSRRQRGPVCSPSSTCCASMANYSPTAPTANVGPSSRN